MARATMYLFVSTLLAGAYICDAYKILMIFPMPSKSHSFLGKGMAKHLLEAGHEITLLTPYLDETPHPNLTQVATSSLQDLMKDTEKYRNIKEIMDGNAGVTNPLIILHLTRTFALKTLEDVNVNKLLEDTTQHFDLVIAEWLFNELFASFAAVFDAPLIWFSSSEPDSAILSIVDEHLNPSYNGIFITDNPPFTFIQRLTQLCYSLQLIVFRDMFISYLQRKDYDRLVAPHIEARGRIAPSFSDLKYNGSLVLGMSHVSMGAAISLPQMYKHIGGFHIEEQVKPLPENLKNIMDNAKDGVIYFSMGSNLRSKDWPDTLKREFVQMFGTLKQTVIWKFEETLPDLPKNLHILQWAPQQSILAHPNCLLFITHGGILSTTETLHAGKPIIGIPVFGDQFSNVIRAVGKGFAIKVDLSYSMTIDLKAAIDEILTNPKYAQKAKELSFVFHDRPAKPGDELVHWAEHVVKTQGAVHLRSPALMIPWYQKYYLDLAFLVGAMFFVLGKVLKTLKPVFLPKLFGTKLKTK